MRVGLLLSVFRSGTPSVVGYSAEAQAVFDLMTDLTNGEKDAMAAFIDSQVSSGNWDLLGCYQDYELLTFANARIDWKGNFNGETPALSGVTHIPKSGLSFSGTQSRGYATNYNTLTDSKWVNNNALIGAYCLENLSTTDQRFLFGSSTLTLWQRTVASRIDFLSVNGLAVQMTSYPSGFVNDKHYTAIQTSNNVKGYEESTLKNTSATGSPSESNATVYVGGRHDGATPFIGKIGCFYAGAGSGFDIANFITNRIILKNALAAL